MRDGFNFAYLHRRFDILRLFHKLTGIDMEYSSLINLFRRSREKGNIELVKLIMKDCTLELDTKVLEFEFYKACLTNQVDIVKLMSELKGFNCDTVLRFALSNSPQVMKYLNVTPAQSVIEKSKRSVKTFHLSEATTVRSHFAEESEIPTQFTDIYKRYSDLNPIRTNTQVDHNDSCPNAQDTSSKTEDITSKTEDTSSKTEDITSKMWHTRKDIQEKAKTILKERKELERRFAEDRKRRLLKMKKDEDRKRRLLKMKKRSIVNEMEVKQDKELSMDDIKDKETMLLLNLFGSK
jgi:hypothetical protein